MVLREDPVIDEAKIVSSLATQYGLHVTSVVYLPIGYDMNAAVYEVVTGDGTSYFLKIRFGPVYEPALEVPRTLIEHGIPNILAPLRTQDSMLWCSLHGSDRFSIVLYPFIRGENAKMIGLTDAQWRTFGSTLQAVHSSGLDERFRDRLPVETFALPSAELVRTLLATPAGAHVKSASAEQFARFWRDRGGQILKIVKRAESLGQELRTKSFDHVLCHSDIHGANILVSQDGPIYLIDWDGPIIAPRERDLLFVVGSVIGRPVVPREESLFFEGYGPFEIDPSALIYYRYERVIEDLGEMAKRILLDPTASEVSRASEATLAMGMFAPGRIIERAEVVSNHRWPVESVR
jgi:spectinomycin phosphotransferase